MDLKDIELFGNIFYSLDHRQDNDYVRINKRTGEIVSEYELSLEEFPDHPSNLKHFTRKYRVKQITCGKRPTLQLITIGDAQKVRDGTVESFHCFEVFGDVGTYILFNKEDRCHFNGEIIQSELEELDDRDPDDATCDLWYNREYTWSGSGRALAIVTPELIAWAKAIKHQVNRLIHKKVKSQKTKVLNSLKRNL
jgi:hypothetical protein